MKFNNKQEAFNYWNSKSLSECETRAKEINVTIDTDPNADYISLNIEADGLREAINNLEEKATKEEETDSRNFNLISKTNFRSNPIPNDLLSSKEYRNAFFKSLMGKDLSTQEQRIFSMAQSEAREAGINTSNNTGAVIPTETLNEIVTKARQLGGAISVARGFNMPSNLLIPVGTPHTKAVWHKEGEPVETEQVEIGAVKFDGNEIIKIFSISNKVKTMSIPAFESFLTDELSSCVTATIADALINGTGEGQGTGLLTGITWNEDNTVRSDGEITYKDITRTIAKLKRGYAMGACFLMNNATLYNSIYGLVDANGRPVFIMDPKVEAIGMMLGFPVVIDDFIPDNTIIFGNPNYLGYNLPQGITVDSSVDSSYRSGLIDYRAIAIADCKPIVEEAFIKLECEDPKDKLSSTKGTVTIGKSK